MDYGEHCATCGRLDFLPVDCRKCGRVFCGDHRVHECVHTSNAAPKTNPIIKNTDQSKPSIAKKTETVPKPATKPSAPLKQAPISGQRLGSSSASKNSRATAALQRLKNLVNAPAKNIKPREGPTPEQKREAIGDHRIPAADRIYLQIVRPPAQVVDVLTKKTTLRPEKTVWMFFDKSLNAGQVLDRAAKQLNVPHGALEVGGKKVDVHCRAQQFAGTKLALVAVK